MPKCSSFISKTLHNTTKSDTDPLVKKIFIQKNPDVPFEVFPYICASYISISNGRMSPKIPQTSWLRALIKNIKNSLKTYCPDGKISFISKKILEVTVIYLLKDWYFFINICNNLVTTENNQGNSKTTINSQC